MEARLPLEEDGSDGHLSTPDELAGYEMEMLELEGGKWLSRGPSALDLTGDVRASGGQASKERLGKTKPGKQRIGKWPSSMRWAELHEDAYESDKGCSGSP
ncbi:hypothetical protein VTH06DRAFT_8360 [Thermothelomyces fergusii]